MAINAYLIRTSESDMDPELQIECFLKVKSTFSKDAKFCHDILPIKSIIACSEIKISIKLIVIYKIKPTVLISVYF